MEILNGATYFDSKLTHRTDIDALMFINGVLLDAVVNTTLLYHWEEPPFHGVRNKTSYQYNWSGFTLV